MARTGNGRHGTNVVERVGQPPRGPLGRNTVAQCTARDEEEAIHSNTRVRIKNKLKQREKALEVIENKAKAAITLPYVSIQHTDIPDV